MDRATFIYLNPKVPHNASQCVTCRKFTGSSCMEFSSKDKIVAEGSCGLYTPGQSDPTNKGKESGSITPQEAGYVVRKVRCEHCEFFEEDDNNCLLFRTLNITPYKVDPDGCCNANQEKDSEKTNSVSEKETKQDILKKFVR